MVVQNGYSFTKNELSRIKNMTAEYILRKKALVNQSLRFRVTQGEYEHYSKLLICGLTLSQKISYFGKCETRRILNTLIEHFVKKLDLRPKSQCLSSSNFVWFGGHLR